MNLETLYGEYGPKVYIYYLHMTGDHHLAEELTQETFFQAVVSIHRFKGDSKVQTWLFGIARNVFLKHSRKASRMPVAQNNLNEVALQQDSPEQRFYVKEQNRIIRDVLLNLPEDYRTVIILRELEGLDYVDIGRIMKKSPDAARVTLFRAKKRFRELYEKQ